MDLARTVPSNRPTYDVSSTSLSWEELNRNLIFVGAADTNIWFVFATIAYRQRYGYSIPLRYSGDELLYFTCDQIVSDMSGEVYPRLEESVRMHCGYLVMIPNPWAPEKTIVLASGTRATGTQAALLALTKNDDVLRRSGADVSDWRSLRANNRFYGNVPAKVVLATAATTIENSDYFSRSEQSDSSPFERISQRHVITDFKYLE